LNDASAEKEAITATIANFPALDAYFRGHAETFKEHLAARKVSPW
jgi:hypothetical protein